MTTPSPYRHAAPVAVGTGLPRRAGAGFKPQHLDGWLGDPAPPAFAEVHAENYLGAGGAPHAWLTRLREDWPLSLHGVGLSIGGEAPLDRAHLERIAALVARYQPAAFSEHLAWSGHDGRFLNDLLPVLRDQRALERVCAQVGEVQDRLGLRLLLENPSTYFEFAASEMSEPEFIGRVLERTGCGLLLDINNVFVSCHNNAADPLEYLDALPLAAIGEIHLAGFAVEQTADGRTLLIDDHGAPVAPEVWNLYARVIAARGPLPTLIERDNAIPSYAELRAEVRLAERILDAAREPTSRCAA